MTPFYVQRWKRKKTLYGSESEEGEETYIVYTSDNKDAILRGRKHSPTIDNQMADGRVMNVSNWRVLPPSGTSLLMELIECRNPVVMNFLIDRMHIETILLTDKKNIVESITSIRENVPNNLSKVVVLCSDSIHLEYYPVPHYRMYSNKIRPPKYSHININEIEERDSLLTEIDQGVNENDLELNKLKKIRCPDCKSSFVAEIQGLSKSLDKPKYTERVSPAADIVKELPNAIITPPIVEQECYPVANEEHIDDFNSIVMEKTNIDLTKKKTKDRKEERQG
uniref:Uncharacterized protein n=1 Tax=Glossina pallidipes TaxID=7398 RepID=A0A1B0A427_GLOPL